MAALRRLASPTDSFLLTSLLCLSTLTVFLALFVFRRFDDNRLTSWLWAYDGVDIRPVFLLLVIAVVLAGVLSTAPYPRRGRGLLLFVSSFATAALFWPLPEVNVDASRYFVQAKSLELYGIGYFFEEWGRGIGAWTDLPLVPFLHGLVLSLFGEARVAIQVFTTLLFSGTVVLTYLIGRTLWDGTVGFQAGMLLLAMPYLLTQVPLMLVDVPAMFFLTLAVWATVRAVRDGKGRFLILAPAAIALAMLSKYSNWLMLGVVPVIFLVHSGVGREQLVRRAGAVALGAVILAGAAVLAYSDVVAQQLSLLLSYQLPGLGRWQESHTSTFLFQIHPFVTAAAVGSVYVAVRKRDPKYAIIAWMPLLLLVLEVKRIRYMVVALPMLALMAAYGLAAIRAARIRRLIASCAVVSMLVTAVAVYRPFLHGTSAVNLQAAGAHLNGIAAEKVAVYVLPQRRSAVNPAVAVPILDFYTDKPVVFHGPSEAAARPASVATSPVRFTWEYGSPPFLNAERDAPDGNVAVVVILDHRAQPLPEPLRQRLADYRLVGEFAETDRAFLYNTVVKVYRPRQTASTTAPAPVAAKGVKSDRRDEY